MDSPFSQEEGAQPDRPLTGAWGGVVPKWYSGLGDTDPEDVAVGQATGLPGGLSHLVRQSVGAGLGQLNLSLQDVATLPEWKQRDVAMNKLLQSEGQTTEEPEPDPTDKARAFLQQMTPDPSTTGTAVQVLHGLGKGLTEMAVGSAFGGPLAGAATVGTAEGTGRYDELTQEGVSRGTAASVSAITGVTSAAGAIIPFGWGAKLLTRMGTGALTNATFGAANRLTDHAILEANGYHELAAQQKVFDGNQLLADLVLGAGFGVMSHLHATEKARIEALQKTPGIEDAAMTTVLAGADMRAAPGVPIDAAAANAHTAALEKAVQDVVAGRKVDVSEAFDALAAQRASEAGIPKEDFLARPAPDARPAKEALVEHLKETGLLDEEANLHDLNRAMKPVKAEPASIPITHEAGELGDHSIKSPNGEALLQESDDHLIVKRDDTAPEAQGKGEGLARMLKAGSLAKEKNLTLASDTSVSPGEAAVFKKLEQNGYDVAQHPDANVNPETGNLTSKDLRMPVFTATPKETVSHQDLLNAAQQYAGGGEAKPQETAPTMLPETQQILKNNPDLEVTHPETGEKMKASDLLAQSDEQLRNDQADIPKAIQAAIGCLGRF